MNEVKSSAFSHLDHDPNTNELHVRFHGGQVHAFSPVTSEEYQQLLMADSMGKHFSTHIRPHKKSRRI